MPLKKHAAVCAAMRSFKILSQSCKEKVLSQLLTPLVDPVYQLIGGIHFSVEVKLQGADLTVVLQRYLNRSLLSKIFEKADKKDESNKWLPATKNARHETLQLKIRPCQLDAF